MTAAALLHLQSKEERMDVQERPKGLISVSRIDVNLKLNCGCGFTASGPQAMQQGVDHANSFGHTLEIGGEIRAVKA